MAVAMHSVTSDIKTQLMKHPTLNKLFAILPLLIMPGPIEHAKSILDNMSSNGFTLTSFWSVLFTSIHFQIEMQELKTSILPTILASQETKVIRNCILKNARAIYMSEVQTLLKKETGLQMVAYKLCLEQLEMGQISLLRNIYPQKAPVLWKLCCQLPTGCG